MDKRPLLIFALGKSNILVMGTCGLNGEVTIHSVSKKEGNVHVLWCDPEGFQHQWGIHQRFWICIPIRQDIV
jgi:hypothetical protein